MKGVLKALLALLIIAGGAGIGYLIANNTDLGKSGPATPTPVVAVAASAATATPIPTFTPAVATNPNGGQGNAAGTRPAGAGNAATTPGAGGATAAAGAQASPQAGQAQGGQRRGNQLAGTVSSFDANSKMLVISAQDGSKHNVAVGNAILTKAEKITLDDISKTNGAILVVQGEKGSDGAYAARSVNLVDPAAAQGAGGNRGGFGGAGAFGGGAGGQGQGGLVVLTGATVSGNTLSGKSFQGEDVKVNVSDSTTMSKQATASLTDLSEGKRVTVTGQTGANGDIEANLIAITG